MANTLFLPPSPLPRTPPKRQTTSPRMCSKGFSNKPKRDPSSSQIRRESASKRYDEMAAAGMPEYTVWMRLKHPPSPTETAEEDMPWLPVGCISVPRSSNISKALLDAGEDLWSGAERLYPRLRNEPRDNVEFGYQVRGFDDEDIRIVERESEEGFLGALKGFFGRLQNPLNTG